VLIFCGQTLLGQFVDPTDPSLSTEYESVTAQMWQRCEAMCGQTSEKNGPGSLGLNTFFKNGLLSPEAIEIG